MVLLSPLAAREGDLLEALRCHRTWMARDAEMTECPPALAGLTVAARGDDDGIALVLEVRDRQLVAELQRRVEAQVAARDVDDREY